MKKILNKIKNLLKNKNHILLGVLTFIIGLVLYLKISSSSTSFILNYSNWFIFVSLLLALLAFSTASINKSISKPNTNKSLSTLKFINVMMVVLFLAGGLIIFNQMQLSSISSSLDLILETSSKESSSGKSGGHGLSGATIYSGSSETRAYVDLSEVDVSSVSSTAMAVATVFPELKNMENEDEILNFMIPTGIPDYSEALGGITFDDPVTSMEYLAKWYYGLSPEIEQNDPEIWQRYLSLAAAPRGISCEFCCGIGPQGITKDGKSRCGCKHNPAVLGLTLGLMQNTDYSDAEILREVMRWKTMFFPKNMVGLAMQVAGTDPSQLKDLPGMVGGC